MAQGLCLFLMLLFGTSVSLANELNVNPSPVVPSSEFKTETPSLPKIESAQYVVESEQYTIIPITRTIKPTPLLTPTRIEPATVIDGMVDAIAPTSVVKISSSEAVDVPAADPLTPKKP
nr:uncharacterized protein LOC117993144 [Maniola hyperantus]